MSGSRVRRRKLLQVRPALRVIPDPDEVGRETDPVAIARAVGAVSAVAHELAGSPFVQTSAVDVDLVEGINKIDHALGVRPLSMTLALHVPSYAFAWGFDPHQPGNPHPDRQAWVEVETDDPVSARIVFFASSAGDRQVADRTGAA